MMIQQRHQAVDGRWMRFIDRMAAGTSCVRSHAAGTLPPRREDEKDTELKRTAPRKERSVPGEETLRGKAFERYQAMQRCESPDPNESGRHTRATWVAA
jgi:hypothetical protein